MLAAAGWLTASSAAAAGPALSSNFTLIKGFCPAGLTGWAEFKVRMTFMQCWVLLAQKLHLNISVPLPPLAGQV